MKKTQYLIGGDARGKNGAAYVDHLPKVAYEPLLEGLVDAHPHFVWNFDSDRVPLGELHRAPAPSLQGELDRRWGKAEPLYALGVVEPRLHVYRDEQPSWSLSWTVLVQTSPAAKKQLRTLRRLLGDELEHSTTYTLADGVAPFRPSGSAWIYPKKPTDHTQLQPLPPGYDREAQEWIHSRKAADRVMLRNLSILYVVGSTIWDVYAGTFVPEIEVSKHQ